MRLLRLDRRRGSKCISQEVPEDLLLSYLTDHGVLRNGASTSDGRTPTTPSIECRTPTTVGSGEGRTDQGIITPASTNSEPLRFLAFYKYSKVRLSSSWTEWYKPSALRRPADVPPGKYEKLSRLLHESLPSREDMEMIFKASRQHCALAYEVLTMPYTTLDQNGLRPPESLLDFPGPNVHPVLISRHMLQLAIFLQHIPPGLHEEITGLSESPRAIMERLVDLAISLVTSNDELLGSIEGLECVMIETMYQVNVGNLRRSWVASRRAMSIAQLMGLNRSENRAQFKVLDPKTEYHPQIMWFRVLFIDRQLCLMLGLPQGSLDRSIASDAQLANETPMGRLERIHCVLASRILERNESNPSSQDLAVTRTLDLELQRAARGLPSKWWLSPNLEAASTTPQALFWDTLRLFAQVLHYNLLNQLHLPYMLRASSSSSSSSSSSPTSSPAAAPDRQYEYSRLTCVNASREVLSRFITLRRVNRIAFSCRIIDFLALMAALTLLLAHLDSRRAAAAPAAENLLAHQYLSDRAMIEQAQENMRELNRVNADALSAQSADLLGRLLAIEGEAAEDGAAEDGWAGRVSVQEAGRGEVLGEREDGEGGVSVLIPYFGIIKIAREGVSKEIPKPHAPATVVGRSSTASTETLGAGFQMRHSGLPRPSGMSDAEVMAQVDVGYGNVETRSLLAQGVPDSYARSQGELPNVAPQQLQNGFSDPLLQQGEYPGLTAGGEDWAFQGVDMAFFDSLMRSTGNEGGEDAEWTTWQK
ncbi:uncharacterized protein BDZ99DRAFT_438821 [Mytilinidion resinicola]|uniref:Xylanolytic transcriptional activator regulatory domain-containing protein n=1 Tax=Mytilinidion resinicola TaxID=574789 RepID=A0A6A6YX87_9PEZI|nr:uncharacterized protein BDZ99DRAFT_438821 [Mytilinidion resinicola]KAF2813562.1 hypothetical protein BDZ99DRAFT_438821 [Mytilinidion resinicola]